MSEKFKISKVQVKVRLIELKIVEMILNRLTVLQR